MCYRRMFASLIVLFGWGLVSTAAEAAPVTFGFSGEVTSASPGTFPIFQLGDVFSGSVTIETATPSDPIVDPTQANYPGAVTDFSFSKGPFSASLAGASATTFNDPFADGLFLFSGGSDLAGFSGNLALLSFNMILFDVTNSWLTALNLPTSSFPDQGLLGGFSVGSLSFLNYDTFDFENVDFGVLSFTVSGSEVAVPVPGAAALMALGLIAVAGARRRSTILR